MKLCFLPGRVGMSISSSDRGSRHLYCTVDRLDSFEKNGLEWAKDIGKKNLEDMLTIIQWNEDNVRFLFSPFPSAINHSPIPPEHQIHAPILNSLPLRLPPKTRLPPPLRPIHPRPPPPRRVSRPQIRPQINNPPWSIHPTRIPA